METTHFLRGTKLSVASDFGGFICYVLPKGNHTTMNDSLAVQVKPPVPDAGAVMSI